MADFASSAGRGGWLIQIEETNRPTTSYGHELMDAALDRHLLGPDADEQSHMSGDASPPKCCSFKLGEKNASDHLLNTVDHFSSLDGSDMYDARNRSLANGSHYSSSDSEASASKMDIFEPLDPTIRAVNPVNTPVSVDILSFPNRPTLPRIHTSMYNSPKLFRLVESPSSSEAASPLDSAKPCVEDKERWSTEKGQPDAMRESAGELVYLLH